MFIKLDNRTVWNYVEEDKTMIKEYGDKIVHTLFYLSSCVTRCGMVHFSIEELITSCGMKVNTKAGNSVEQFRKILLMLQENGILSDIRYNMDLNKAKCKEMIVCQLNLEYKKDKDGKDTQFFMIDWDNYCKILSCNEKNKINIINVYSYLLSRMSTKDEYTDVRRDGGNSEGCWVEEKTIAKDLCISKNTVIKCIDKLIELGLIFKDNTGKVINKKGKTSNGSNVYTVKESDIRDTIKGCQRWYEANGYIITDKKINKEALSVYGLKGQIDKQKAQGKDITKLENKLFKKQEKLKEEVVVKFEYSKNKEYIEARNEQYEDYEEEETDNKNVDKMWSDGSLLGHLQCLVIEYNDYVEKDNRVNNMDAFINKFRNIEDIDELDVKIKDFKHLVEVAQNECYDGADDLI